MLIESMQVQAKVYEEFIDVMNDYDTVFNCCDVENKNNNNFATNITNHSDDGNENGNYEDNGKNKVFLKNKKIKKN
jgi:hypothetical protein